MLYKIVFGLLFCAFLFGCRKIKYKAPPIQEHTNSKVNNFFLDTSRTNKKDL
jgi:hypothetical protein